MPDKEETKKREGREVSLHELLYNPSEDAIHQFHMSTLSDEEANEFQERVRRTKRNSKIWWAGILPIGVWISAYAYVFMETGQIATAIIVALAVAFAVSVFGVCFASDMYVSPYD